MRRDEVRLEKLYLFHTISDENDFYIIIVDLDEIYKFVVLSFLFKVNKMIK
jgi:hypothetical protein